MQRPRRALIVAAAALAAFLSSVAPVLGQGEATEDVSPTGEIDLGTIPPDRIVSAVASARKEIRLQGDSAEGYLHLAVALGSGDDQQGARVAIDRALALNPRLPGAWLQKALISINGGTLKDAIGYLQKEVEYDPQSVSARLEALSDALPQRRL